jgi:hypothetical protein
MRAITMLLGECLVFLIHFFRVNFLPEVRDISVHIVHIMLTGILFKLYLRIHTDQLLDGILHGEDTADDNRTLRIHWCLACKDLREALIHTLGDGLVLLSA